MPENRAADSVGSAAEQAEMRTEETLSFMQSVRRATRRKYTPEGEDPDRTGRVPPRAMWVSVRWC